MISIFGHKPGRPHCPFIYVSAEALAGGDNYYDAAQDVVDYTNAVFHDSLYKLGEFPHEAYALYLADYYVAEVKNGGHSRYLGNDRNSLSSTSSLPEALGGLDMIGCKPYADCLRDLQKWVKGNPKEAAAQNGFNVRADALEELDSRFFALDDKVYYEEVKNWLRDSKMVRALPSSDLPAMLAAVKEKNPLLATRKRVNYSAALDAGLTHDTIAVYRACASGITTHGKIFEIQSIFNGQPSPLLRNRIDDDFMRPEHQLWQIVANTGTLYGQVDGDMVEIYARNPEDGKYGLMFECPLERAKRQIKVASGHRPARFAQRLLQMYSPEDLPAFLSFLDPEPNPKDIVFYGVSTQGKKQYQLAMTNVSAGLFTWPERAPLAVVNGKEFKALAREDHSKLV